MTINPYADQDLENMLREAELVADNYYDGGLILIRTKDGWRAFVGTLKEDYQRKLEAVLDKNVPSYEKFDTTEIDRNVLLTEEFLRLFIDIGQMMMGKYTHMKFTGNQDNTK